MAGICFLASACNRCCAGKFELVYCLAVFCTLKKIGRELVAPHLKSSFVPVYDDRLNDLNGKADLVAELSSIRSIGKGVAGT